MANVCIYCFSDRELVAFINSQNLISNCSFCNSHDVYCIQIDELFDYFAELLSHFRVDKAGNPLKATIQGNWNLFSSLNNAYSILNYFISKNNLQIKSADELVSFSQEIIENVGHWDVLKNQLFTQSRYITDVNYLTDELGWDGFFSSQIEISKGKQLYRARLHHTSGESPYDIENMFCPPAAISKAGRANPTGIPYLYLSDNPETVIYETRATYLDEISIGTFEIEPNVTQPVIISDFTESSTIFHPSRTGDKIKASLLKQKISSDLSKPMRRSDTDLEYVPTQFICEFIKVYTGVQGIKFRSSLHVIGNNFVIFNQELMVCTQIRQVKVEKVSISFEDLTQ